MIEKQMDSASLTAKLRMCRRFLVVCLNEFRLNWDETNVGLDAASSTKIKTSLRCHKKTEKTGESPGKRKFPFYNDIVN